MNVEFIEQSHEIIHVSGGWQQLARGILADAQEQMPVVFDDIEVTDD